MQLNWGERMLVQGDNGSGKTTLLQALLGRMPLAAGRGSLGSSVRVGEIDQGRLTFAAEARLLDAFCAESGLLEPDARTLLAKFGLGADDVGRPVARLSPGERTRADLALLMHSGANLLVLDEPTNHLDLPAIEQLEQALDRYDGTLLIVTHDRRLAERVRVTRRLTVSAGTVTQELSLADGAAGQAARSLVAAAHSLAGMDSPLLTVPGAVRGRLSRCRRGRALRRSLRRAAGAGRDRLGLVDRSDRDVLRISGPDRLSWLNSLSTQKVDDLPAGSAQQSLILSPNGHVEHHLSLIDDGSADLDSRRAGRSGSAA